MKKTLLVIVFAGSTAIATTAFAQPGSGLSGGSELDRAILARHEIFVMERVLEQKVQLGAQMLSERFRAAGLPDVVLFAGATRARGILLDGYGVLFDLDVPALRLSMAWSLRVMGQPDPDMADALERLRELSQTLNDGAIRARLDAALALLDARVGVPAGRASSSNGRVRTGGVISEPAGPSPREGAQQVLEDPSTIYTNQVRAAVIDAMLDHSGPMKLAPGDWLTVAAREDMAPRLLSGDPDNVPRTMILRVRGTDVTAFREGRLSREEAVRRVEVSNF